MVQVELNRDRTAVQEFPTRITAMLKKRGPYLRKVRLPRPKSHFIREWRERADMTQQALATEADLSVAAISSYELGTSDPSVDALKAISAALGVPKGMLLDVDPNDDPPLWAGFLRATKEQKREIGRIVGALVGTPKGKKQP